MKILGLQPGNARATSGLFVGANGVFARGAGNPGSSSSVNPDAAAFLAATGITDPTISAAINTYVNDLQGYSLWTLMYALYPFVGGTADTHKYNLVNPVDTNGGFRLTWSGTVTHNANGVTGNGADGSGDTHLVPSSVISLNNEGLTVYARNNTNGGFDLGCTSTAGGFSGLAVRYSNAMYGYLSDLNNVNVANTDSTGCWTISRTNGTEINFYKNGAAFGSNPKVGGIGTRGTSSELVLAANGVYSARNLAMAAVHQGLTSTQAANFYTATQTFQTALGRQV